MAKAGRNGDSIEVSRNPNDIGIPVTGGGGGPDPDVKMVRFAIKQNPFAKYHQTYNRNLINDDNQEITAHLRRRTVNARRISKIIETTGSSSPPPPPPRSRHSRASSMYGTPSAQV